MEVHALDETMTPNGNGQTMCAWDGDGFVNPVVPICWQLAIQEPTCAPKADKHYLMIPTYTSWTQIPPLLWSDTLPGNDNEQRCTTPASISGKRFCQSFAATVSDRQCHEQQVETASTDAKTLFSKGSIGHPFSCAKACKYAKKKKGCKDGDLCDRCHLCDWKRCESGWAACRAAARSG